MENKNYEEIARQHLELMNSQIYGEDEIEYENNIFINQNQEILNENKNFSRIQNHKSYYFKFNDEHDDTETKSRIEIKHLIVGTNSKIYFNKSRHNKILYVY
jgi:hypothetical protein